VPFSGICIAVVTDVGVCIPILENIGEGFLRERAFQRHLHALDDGLKLILLETKSFFCGEV
jgi:hypothetical protein